MISAEKLALYRARFKNPTGRFCDCGRPAIKMVASSYICARCESFEGKRYNDVRQDFRVAQTRLSLRPDRKATRKHEGELEGFQKPKSELGWGSLKWLELKLATIGRGN